MSKALWIPSPDAVDCTSVSKLLRVLNLKDYASLHKWSIENIDLFWDEVWRSTNVIGSKGEITFEEGNEFFKSKFFPDSLLNVGENLLSNELTVEIAITAIAEDGKTVEMTWDQLRAEVASVAYAMLSDGIRPKDRVVAWSPNIAQTIIFSLAALSIGAVVSTASSDFAAAAVLDRFAQIEPVLLLAASSYAYNGKSFDVTDNLKSIAKGLPTLKRVVVVGEINGNFTSWNDWKASFINTQLSFERFNFDHPGFILFSSGTTGKPKCIIHSAAGVLLKLKAEQLYNFDLSSKDKIFFYTTTGWMMWNWLLYCLASKTSIVLYDGSPTFPNVDRLLEIAQSQNCTHLGVSAKYIDLLKKSEITIKDKNSISNLRMLISTGSVLAPESFDYVYQNLKSNIHLASISGGTDICGCFVSAVPVLAVYAGQIQGACLGMAVEVFDEQANPTIIDQKGELVCTKPFPSMPLGFWNDNNNEIYRKSYFSKFKNIWTHGDYVSKSKQSGFVILGRSDATLNSKGVRIGTAEIYRVVDEIPEVLESLAVAKQVESDTKVILFVVLKPSEKLSEQLISKIKSELKGKASPRHVPDLIIQAPHLPRTKSNKLVEIAVADTINGKSVRNKDALANPEALDWFAQVDLSTLI